MLNGLISWSNTFWGNLTNSTGGLDHRTFYATANIHYSSKLLIAVSPHNYDAVTSQPVGLQLCGCRCAFYSSGNLLNLQRRRSFFSFETAECRCFYYVVCNSVCLTVTAFVEKCLIVVYRWILIEVCTTVSLTLGMGWMEMISHTLTNANFCKSWILRLQLSAIYTRCWMLIFCYLNNREQRYMTGGAQSGYSIYRTEPNTN